MSKKMMLVILLAVTLITLQGCSIWAYTDDSVDSLGVRAGLNVDGLEAGVLNYRNPYDDGNDAWGAYAIAHLANDEAIDPYIGVQTTDELDLEEYCSPLAGIGLGPVFVEYQRETIYGEKDAIVIGTRWEW